MKRTHLLKKLALTVSIIALAACSSNKKNEDNAADGMADNQSMQGGEYGNNGSGIPLSQGQIESLEKTNVVYFGLNKYDILSEYARLLDTHASFLRDNPSYKIVIEGHADERGTPEYNIALGENRANAVSMYLRGKGVAQSQISIVSYGKEKPAVSGHDEAAYAKNRRAVVVY